MQKPIKEIDDLELVPCPKHRDAVIGCKACKVVKRVKFYYPPEKLQR